MHLLWKRLWYIRCAAPFCHCSGHRQTRGYTYIIPTRSMVNEVSFIIPLWWSFNSSLNPMHHIHICQVSAQLGCVDACTTWTSGLTGNPKNRYSEWCNGLVWGMSPWRPLLDLVTRWSIFKSLQWLRNGRDSVSNHSLTIVYSTSKVRCTGLCAGNSPGTGEFPAEMASNAEIVSIWWRHHVNWLQHIWCSGILRFHLWVSDCQKEAETLLHT